MLHWCPDRLKSVAHCRNQIAGFQCLNWRVPIYCLGHGSLTKTHECRLRSLGNRGTIPRKNGCDIGCIAWDDRCEPGCCLFSAEMEHALRLTRLGFAHDRKANAAGWRADCDTVAICVVISKGVEAKHILRAKGARFSPSLRWYIKPIQNHHIPIDCQNCPGVLSSRKDQ